MQRPSFRVIQRKSNGLLVAKIIFLPSHLAARISKKIFVHGEHRGTTDDLWHRRLAHPDDTVTKYMISSTRYCTYDTSKKQRQRYQTCTEIKIVNEKSTESLIGGSPATTVRANIYGPTRTSFLQKCRYFLILSIARQRHTRVFFLKQNSGIEDQCSEFIARIERNTQIKVRIFQSNIATELLLLKIVSNKRTMAPPTSSAYTLQFNSLALQWIGPQWVAWEPCR